jgi:hypothetical protein
MDTTRGTPIDTTVVGVFEGHAEARRAVAELRAAGFADGQLGIIGPDWQEATRTEEHRTGLANDPTHTQWEEGAGVGAAAGGAAGLGLGLAVATGLIPPLGPVIAGGTLVALLASAGAGAAVGTVVGGLVGLGIPEDQARWADEELNAGRVLVTVHAPDGRADEARSLIRGLGGRVKEAAGVGVYGTGLPATPY